MVAFMDPRFFGIGERRRHANNRKVFRARSHRLRESCEHVILVRIVLRKDVQNCDRSTRRTVQTPRLNGSGSCCGDVVQLVRTLPRHSLESYTVTADSFYPVLFGGFLCLLAVRSHILRCIRADLTAVFNVATV